MRLPDVVIAADWSIRERHRRVARAELCADDGLYWVFAPEEAGDLETFFARIRSHAPAHGTALAGFDFPIGVPRRYAERVGVASFREALVEFGHGKWDRFFLRTDAPSVVQPFFPTYELGQKGGHLKDRLVESLGVASWDDLLLRCDQKTSARGAAQCLFFTLGPKQVGAAAITGWRDVLQPALDGIKLWPFDGPLDALLGGPGIVVAEIYPAEAYTHLGLRIGAGTKLRKGRREDRKTFADGLLALGHSATLRYAPDACRAIEEGFESDDAFDAMVGLLSMLLVVTGQRPFALPDDDPEICRTEGWILGQTAGPQSA